MELGIGHDNSAWGGGTSGNMVMNNSLYENDYGIYCYNSSSPLLLNNSIYNSTSGTSNVGITLVFCYNAAVCNNSISGAISENAGGIYLSNVNNSVFKNNTICNYKLVTNTAIGMYMDNSNHNEFSDIKMCKLDTGAKTDIGIYIINSSNNSISNIEVYDLIGEYGYRIYIDYRIITRFQMPPYMI